MKGSVLGQRSGLLGKGLPAWLREPRQLWALARDRRAVLRALRQVGRVASLSEIAALLAGGLTEGRIFNVLTDLLCEGSVRSAKREKPSNPGFREVVYYHKELFDGQS